MSTLIHRMKVQSFFCSPREAFVSAFERRVDRALDPAAENNLALIDSFLLHVLFDHGKGAIWTHAFDH